MIKLNMKNEKNNSLDYIYIDEELKEDDVFFEFDNTIDFDEFVGGDDNGEE